MVMSVVNMDPLQSSRLVARTEYMHCGLLCVQLCGLQSIHTSSGVYWGSFLAIKWPGHEVNHSSSSSAKIKNKLACTSSAPFAFMVWIGTNLLLPFFYQLCVNFALYKKDFCLVSVLVFFGCIEPTAALKRKLCLIIHHPHED